MNRRAENRKRKLFCGAWILAGALLLGALTGCGGEPAVTVLPGTSVESTVSPSETPSSATGTTEPSSETKTPVSTQGNTEPPSSSSGASTQTPTVVPVSGVTVAPEVLTLKVGDNITTDHIMPAGSKILPYRSNIPKLSEFCFAVCDKEFAQNAKAAGETILVGGSNYGQGSSREHAALVPMYLGIRCVIAKSFARIHVANLINAGILPVTFENPEDYDKLNQDAVLTISDIASGMEQGRLAVTADDGLKFYVNCALTERQRAILMAGGLLNYTKEGGQ